MKIIATDFVHSPAIHNGMTQEECEKYPGSGWIPWLHTYAAKEGMGVVSALEAAKLIDSKQVDPKDVYVVSEEYGEGTWQLEQRGANLSVLFSMESPMYSPIFYDHCPEIKSKFKRSILFSFAHGNTELYFPSYEVVPEWNKERKDKACMISSNKQWWSLYPRWESPSFRMAIRHELHTARLNEIYNYGSTDDLDLYGNGWDEIRLPPQFKEISDLIRNKLRPKPVQNKFDTLTYYEKTICYENVRLAGYITEKQIHAAISGCRRIASDLTDPADEDDFILYNREWALDPNNPYRYSSFAKLVMDAVL